MVYLDDKNIFSTLLPSCMSVLKAPKAFFRGLPPTPYFRGSILVLTAISMVSGFVVYPFYGALMMFMFPVVWIMLVIGMLSWAHFLSWGIRTFSDARLVPSNAFALSAFASTPLVLGFVPWLGLAMVLWSAYLMWTGVVERGKIGGGLALALVMVPITILLATSAGLIMLLPQLAAVL